MFLTYLNRYSQNRELERVKLERTLYHERSIRLSLKIKRIKKENESLKEERKNAQKGLQRLQKKMSMELKNILKPSTESDDTD